MSTALSVIEAIAPADCRSFFTNYNERNPR
jgi:hypothetical protein